jgi:hypothetical protein
LVRLTKKLMLKSRKFAKMLLKIRVLLLKRWWKLSPMLKLNFMKIIVFKHALFIYPFFFFYSSLDIK